MLYNIETMLLIANSKKETLHEQKRYFQMVHLTKRLFVIQLLLLSLLAHFIVHRNSFSFLDSHWHFHLEHKCSCSQALIDKGAKYNIHMYLSIYITMQDTCLSLLNDNAFVWICVLVKKKAFQLITTSEK